LNDGSKICRARLDGEKGKHKQIPAQTHSLSGEDLMFKCSILSN